MEIINVPISEIAPYKRNPRRIKNAVGPVAESIREFGFKQPIILDAGNVVVAGHVRLEAAKRLGMEHVPCVRVGDLSPEEVKALRLADNRTRDLSKWDSDKLLEEMDKIETGEDGIDMSKFGFDLPTGDDRDGRRLADGANIVSGDDAETSEASAEKQGPAEETES